MSVEIEVQVNDKVIVWMREMEELYFNPTKHVISYDVVGIETVFNNLQKVSGLHSRLLGIRHEYFKLKMALEKKLMQTREQKELSEAASRIKNLSAWIAKGTSTDEREIMSQVDSVDIRVTEKAFSRCLKQLVSFGVLLEESMRAMIGYKTDCNLYVKLLEIGIIKKEIGAK